VKSPNVIKIGLYQPLNSSTHPIEEDLCRMRQPRRPLK
jgi:hypothetical protein